MKVTIKQRGINETARFFDDQISRVHRMTEVLPKEAATLYRNELVSRIKSQTFPGATIALSSKYLRKKIRRGLDPRIHIATSKYLDSIKVFKVRGENKYFVGPSPYQKVPNTDLYYSQLGAMLESTRAHLRPIFKALKNKRDIHFKLIYNVYS